MMKYIDVQRMRKVARTRDANHDAAMMRSAWRQGWETSDPSVQPVMRAISDDTYNKGLAMAKEYDKAYSPDRQWRPDNALTDFGTAAAESVLDSGPAALARLVTQDAPYVAGMPVAHAIEKLTGSPDIKDKWWAWTHGVGGRKFLDANPIARVQNGLTNMAKTWLYRDANRHPHSKTFHGAAKTGIGMGLNMLSGKYIMGPLLGKLPQGVQETITRSPFKGRGIGGKVVSQFVPASPMQQGTNAIVTAAKEGKPVK